MNLEKPKLIVFDLDYTLWPFWVDTHVDPPFTKAGGEVFDKYGKLVKHYNDVPRMLEHLKAEGYDLCIASRTSEITGAKQLLELFGWKDYFKRTEIYPACKKVHFYNIQTSTKVEYKDMLFFDDENRNIADISDIGGCAFLVEDGMTMEILGKGLLHFSKTYKK